MYSEGQNAPREGKRRAKDSEAFWPEPPEARSSWLLRWGGERGGNQKCGFDHTKLGMPKTPRRRVMRAAARAGLEVRRAPGLEQTRGQQGLDGV